MRLAVEILGRAKRAAVRSQPRLVILGKQGAGKGTQSERLAGRFRIPRISTGDMFRAAVRAGSGYGRAAQKYMDAGELVPDDVVIGLVEERLSEKDAQEGFILDGFPRTAQQAEALDELLRARPLDLVVELAVPTEVVLRRLASRRVCRTCGANYNNQHPPLVEGICDLCGGALYQRDDDTEAAIKRRLDVYTAETEPLVAYYLAQDKLAAIDGDGPADTVTARLVRGVEGRLDGRRST